MDKKETNRLPDFIKPSHYNITIEPSQDMNLYKGSVQIKATIEKPTNNIVLNAKSIEIKTATICIGTQCLLPKLKKDDESETIVLENPKPIKGDIEINIEFSGIISEDLAGIYKSTYEHKGKKEYLITTQCEAPYARKIFPCFDEPNKKATFDLTIIIEKNLKSISNTKIKSEEIKDDKKIVKFKTTPKMSTYLLYLGIGNFEFIEDNYKEVELRIITTPGKTKDAKFALKYTKRYLEYFEIPYPLEKLDLLAIPDFGAGAMENWGAITFRELLLLVNEKTSENIKKRVAEVIAHELWHQWSGNLVTMNWWNDLWLNESFANYMAYKAVDHYNPEWKIWDDYLSEEFASGLFKDTLKTTHSIKVKVNKVQEIEEIFDEISYSKGGSVLRMLDNYMGEESFRKGVSNYLKKYKYSNADASDLWDSLDQVEKSKKVKELMEYWVSQEGYPLVSVKETPNGIKISQKRCNKDTSQIWPIPISIFTKKKEHQKILEKAEEEYPIKETSIKINHKHLGFYRTKYSKELLRNLGILIKEKKLQDHDRWGAQNDLWALCSIGEESLENYFSFLDNYLDETNYSILVEIYSSIKKLDRLYYYESFWNKTKEKIAQKFIPTYKRHLERLGWERKLNESTEDTLMRALCINFCGFAEDKETIKMAQTIYEKDNFDTNIANAIYSIITKDNNEYEKMLEKYENSKDLESKLKLLSALYQFTKPEILEKALDLALTEKVRVQNILYSFGGALSNPASQKIVLKWSQKNWEKMKKHETNNYVFKRYIETLIISQVTIQGKAEVKYFLEKNKVTYERTKANSFEILDLNLKFIEKNRNFLKLIQSN